MASLTIRNIPEHVMKRLREAAEEQRRSINAQSLVWLEEAAGRWVSREDRERIFDEIEQTRERLFRKYGKFPDSAKLVRKMRDERTEHWSRRGH